MIKKGTIINQRDLSLCPYKIRVLNSNDISLILDLQDYVLGSMKNKSFCVPLSPEEHQDIINGNGETIGLFIQDQLYAVCSIMFPGHRKDNMARELNFSDEELLNVAQFELSIVHPNFRGNNLQEKMAKMLAQRAKKKKDYRYLFTTVSPYNYPSIKTVTSMGLNIAKLGKMYYQWDRYVVYKDIINPLMLDKSSTIHIPGTFLEKQQELLSNGYFGYSHFINQEGIKIMFAKGMNVSRGEVSGR